VPKAHRQRRAPGHSRIGYVEILLPRPTLGLNAGGQSGRPGTGHRTRSPNRRLVAVAQRLELGVVATTRCASPRPRTRWRTPCSVRYAPPPRRRRAEAAGRGRRPADADAGCHSRAGVLKVAGRDVAAVRQTVREGPARSWHMLPGTILRTKSEQVFPSGPPETAPFPRKVWKKCGRN
jgi:hypothetical protein